jgi:hypothetical protein
LRGRRAAVTVAKIGDADAKSIRLRQDDPCCHVGGRAAARYLSCERT